MWQSSHVPELAMWVECLPPAIVPLWQLEQFPVTVLWSTTAGDQPVVL
ncbi:MAG: hypothetical protein GY938_10125 [Ketobacter sp.]|nr:hypothetical protein [Ketobacter sp.]